MERRLHSAIWRNSSEMYLSKLASRERVSSLIFIYQQSEVGVLAMPGRRMLPREHGETYLTRSTVTSCPLGSLGRVNPQHQSTHTQHYYSMLILQTGVGWCQPVSLQSVVAKVSFSHLVSSFWHNSVAQGWACHKHSHIPWENERRLRRRRWVANLVNHLVFSCLASELKFNRSSALVARVKC